jgi:DNA excision repair protein ERCC-4
MSASISRQSGLEIGTLATGDYSIKGIQELCTVERKSLSDCLCSISADRERFLKELQRLRAYRCRALVIEANMRDILEHKYRSNMAPEAVIGSLAAFQIRYELPIVFCGDATGAARYTLAILRNFYRNCAEFAKQFSMEDIIR